MSSPTNVSRALRRHHAHRLKAARKSYYAGWPSAPKADKALGMLVHTATLCSCPMCGNPRKWQGTPSLQEQRALQAFRADGPECS